MKTTTIVIYLMSLLLFIPAAHAELKIDFTQTGGPVEVGYEGYFAGHENPATFTAQSYSAFGATIMVTPSWAAGATAAAMQMIDRAGNDGEDTPDLMRDWIGTDNRQVGDPMTLTISGLPAGDYAWLSYHHDTEDQTGIFDVVVTDALGSRSFTGIDISDGAKGAGIVNIADVTKFATDLTSDGSDITLTFHSVFDPDTAPTSMKFFLMNGFELVPEPATIALLGLGALALRKRRRS